jgi:hypothetical protein
MRETFDRSFVSTGTESGESITSSIAGALGLFAGQSLTSYTKDEVLAVEVNAVVGIRNRREEHYNRLHFTDYRCGL